MALLVINSWVVGNFKSTTKLSVSTTGVAFLSSKELFSSSWITSSLYSVLRMLAVSKVVFISGLRIIFVIKCSISFSLESAEFIGKYRSKETSV